MPTTVLIAGGGPAGLEAALALHRLAGEKVSTTVLAPEDAFVYRPLSVLFDAPAYPLEGIAQDAGFTHVRDRLAAVDVAAREVRLAGGGTLGYDVLLVAAGARTEPPFADAIAFTGAPQDQERVLAALQSDALAFVVPAGPTWPLPVYELALLAAGRTDAALHLVTPEPVPLARFGEHVAEDVRALLARARVTVHAGTEWTPGLLAVEHVITVPRLAGPDLPGLPAGFLVTDEHGRVEGAPGVYAAGDVTAFEIKQGGIACQQADAAAEHIAALAGAPLQPEPFTPRLQGLLLTEHWAHYLRPGGAVAQDARGLSWPPAKIAGRELARYLKASTSS
ncbi:MAG TPA: FAD-dependent oxidoreductase [Solirubrobacter sp.]|nr:FAD-dependent oxidoreductase [Solirubrobacter sp.]